MSNIHDFLEFEAAQIAADSLLTAYCQATYGRVLSCFIGEDPTRVLELAEDAPFLTFLIGAPQYQSGGHVIKREVRVGVCVPRKVGSDPKANLIPVTTNCHELIELKQAEILQQHLFRILHKMKKSTGSKGVIEAVDGGIPDAIATETVQTFLAQVVSYDSEIFTS